MTTTTKDLKEQAEIAKLFYKTGAYTREQAKAEIMPYINEFNKKSREIAKKYKQRPKTISFTSYIR